MSEMGDRQAEEAGIGGELVRVESEQILEARPLPGAGDGSPGTGIATRKVSLPATITAASGGFMLGVAAFMLVRVLRSPTAARSVARRRKRLLARRQGVEVAASRSFLVDVHLLKR